MGIDIRDGNQLECITCALCIDACNDIMAKVDKPRGLISYTTLRDYNAHGAEAETAGRAAATAHQRSVGVSHIVGPRTLIYFGLWSLIGIAMLVGSPPATGSGSTCSPTAIRSTSRSPTARSATVTR